MDSIFDWSLRGYDKDGDGRVTAAEIREFHLAQGAGERESDEALSHMWSFDHDRDGGLSAEEFCHWFHSPFPFHAFQGYDANSDRKFSAEEIQEFHEGPFSYDVCYVWNLLTSALTGKIAQLKSTFCIFPPFTANVI